MYATEEERKRARAESNKKWYEKTREIRLVKSKEQYQKRKDKHNIAVRNWQAKNQIKIKEWRKNYLYKRVNNERTNAVRREYRKKNIERQIARERAWYAKNREWISIRRKRRRQEKALLPYLEENRLAREKYYSYLWWYENERILNNRRHNERWAKSPTRQYHQWKGRHIWCKMTPLEKKIQEWQLYGRFGI